MSKKTLYLEFDKETERMSCKCEASVEDLVEMTGYLLRHQVILVAKEVAKSRGTKITESQGKRLLKQIAKRYSEKKLQELSNLVKVT